VESRLTVRWAGRVTGCRRLPEKLRVGWSELVLSSCGEMYTTSKGQQSSLELAGAASSWRANWPRKERVTSCRSALATRGAAAAALRLALRLTALLAFLLTAAALAVAMRLDALLVLVVLVAARLAGGPLVAVLARGCLVAVLSSCARGCSRLVVQGDNAPDSLGDGARRRGSLCATDMRATLASGSLGVGAVLLAAHGMVQGGCTVDARTTPCIALVDL